MLPPLMEQPKLQQCSLQHAVQKFIVAVVDLLYILLLWLHKRSWGASTDGISICSRNWSLIASQLTIFLVLLSRPPSLLQEQEKMQGSQNDAQRCWPHYHTWPCTWGGCSSTGMGTRMGICDQGSRENLQKGFVLGNNLSMYAICSKGF